MRTITRIEIIIRLIFFIFIVSAGLVASVMEDKKVVQEITSQQKQVIVTMHKTSNK